MQNTGAIVTSSDPTGGASAWTLTPGVANAPLALSCPTVSLCVGGGVGGVVTSTDPTGGASAWRTAPVGAVVPLTGVSCPSVSLCVASDDANRVLISTDPTAPGSVWSAAALPRLTTTGCGTSPARPPRCAWGSAAGIRSSPRPTRPAAPRHGRPQTWSPTSPISRSSDGVSCPSVSLCVAVNDWGDVFVSRNPTSSPPTWTRTREGPAPSPNPWTPASKGFRARLCPCASRSTTRRRAHNHLHDPGRSPSSVESHARQGTATEDSIACRVPRSPCAWRPTPTTAASSSRRTLLAARPRGGGSRSLGFIPVRPISVSCATQSLCVAIDEFSGRVIASADPSGGAASWSAAQIDLNDLPHGGGLSCNRSFCIVGDDVGAVVLGVPAPRPTPAQLRKALRKQLVPSARGAAFLLKRGGYRYSFRIPAAGRLTVSWSSTARRGPARQRLRPILIATAKTYLSADTTDRAQDPPDPRGDEDCCGAPPL